MKKQSSSFVELALLKRGRWKISKHIYNVREWKRKAKIRKIKYPKVTKRLFLSVFVLLQLG